MEKMFEIRRNGNQVMFCPPDHDPIQMKANVRVNINKFTETNKFDPEDWSWGLRLVESGSKVAADLRVGSDYVFAGTGMYIGSGILLVLNTVYRGDHYEGQCRRYDISVSDLMRKLMINKISHRCPKESSYYERNGMNCVRVFSLEGEEQKDLDGIFTLDENVPYVLHHSRLQGNKKREWKSLYIPKGWKWNQPAKAKYDHPAPQPEPEVEQPIAAESAAPETPTEAEKELEKATEEIREATPAPAEEAPVAEPAPAVPAAEASVEVTVG